MFLLLESRSYPITSPYALELPTTDCGCTEISIKGNLYANALDALVGLASILVKPNPEKALLLGATISQHSTSTLETRIRAEKLVAEMKQRLPEQQVEVVLAQARLQSIDEIGREIMRTIPSR